LFGLLESDNSGKVAYPAVQAAPSISTSFPHIFNNKKGVMCLIPQVLFFIFTFYLLREKKLF